MNSRLIVCLLAALWLPSSGFAAITADAAVQELQVGNARFQAGQPTRPNQDAARRGEVAAEQTPMVTLLSCSDSRVPVEMISTAGSATFLWCGWRAMSPTRMRSGRSSAVSDI